MVAQAHLNMYIACLVRSVAAAIWFSAGNRWYSPGDMFNWCNHSVGSLLVPYTLILWWIRMHMHCMHALASCFHRSEIGYIFLSGLKILSRVFIIFPLTLFCSYNYILSPAAVSTVVYTRCFNLFLCMRRGTVFPNEVKRYDAVYPG